MLVLLIVVTITDLRERIIPNKFIAAGIIVIFIVHYISRVELFWTYFLAGIGVLVSLTMIAALTGGRTIGGGDIKLFALIAFAVGFSAFLYIFAISHVLAAVFIIVVKLFRLREMALKDDIAFAPFILFGTGITYWLLLIN